jgi:transcriptional regulator with XRE-family HTH domain
VLIGGKMQERLRLARTNAGFTVGEATELLGIAVGEIEASRRKASATELVKMCRLYQVTVSSIVGGKIEMSPREALRAMDAGEITEYQFMEVVGLSRIQSRIEAERMRDEVASE